MGITPDILSETVELLLKKTAKTDRQFDDMIVLAVSLKERGLEAQITYLFNVLDYHRSEEALNKLNALDVFVRRVHGRDAQ